MTKATFWELVKKARARQDAVMLTKNLDYSREDDYLHNLRDAATRLGLPMRMVLAVHVAKQFDALIRWCRDGILAGEPLESRLTDICNYAYLLEAVYDETADAEPRAGKIIELKDGETPAQGLARVKAGIPPAAIGAMVSLATTFLKDRGVTKMEMD